MSFSTDVSWAPGDTVTSEKLSQMVANDRFLFANMVRWNYIAYGMGPITQGLKVASGIVQMPIDVNGLRITQRVEFPRGFFTAGCRPVVVATAATLSVQRTMLIIRGTESADIHPSHVGFVVSFTSQDQTKYEHPHFVHYIAMGY